MGAVTAAPTSSASTSSTPPLLECVGFYNVDFDPPIYLLPGDSNFSGDALYSGCGALPGAPDSGTSDLAGTGNYSCLAGVGGGRQEINWNDPGYATRHIEFTTVSLRPLGESTIVFLGKVTSGYLSGYSVRQVVEIITPDLTGCLTGIDNLGGPSVITFTAA
ncbi:hypothetical protein [Streptomyces lavendulocolor]|uniref:hypothetical protein n=1 Tax=Streptomyces lavendulocolor TaxID=67316 RepID=UPI003C2E2B93